MGFLMCQTLIQLLHIINLHGVILHDDYKTEVIQIGQFKLFNKGAPHLNHSFTYMLNILKKKLMKNDSINDFWKKKVQAWAFKSS